MQNKKQIHISPKKQKIATNLYLFLVTLYFLLASAQLINLLVNLTVGSDVGIFFEFVNATIDRTIVYALNTVIILYLITKSRNLLPVFLFFAYVLAGYFSFIPIIDVLIIVTSFVALVWFLTSSKPFSTMKRKKAISIIAVYMILILVILEVSALICWFIFPFAPQLSQEGMFRYMVDLETKIFLLTGSLAPVFTMLFLFSWITKPFIPHFKVLKRFFTLFTNGNNSLTNVQMKSSFPLLLLVFPIILSFLVVLYPFTPRLNVGINPVGVDLLYYEEWLTESANNDFFSVISASFVEHPDRPLSLLTLYIVKCASSLTASTVIKFFPLFLAPLLVSAVYFFMHETSTLSHAPLFAAFLAVSSFQVSVMMYGFFLSNWMALIVLYLFMGVYFSSLKKKSCSRMVVALLLSIVLLFTHSWTWGMAIGVLFAYLLLTTIHHRKNLTAARLETRFLIILILVNVSAYVARNYALGQSAGTIEVAKFAQNTITIGGLESFGNDLFYTFFNTHYGFFVNPMALLLAVLGSFIIVSEDTQVNRYLTALLLGSSIFFVLGSGWVIKSRILLNIFLPVLEAIGLIGVISVAKKVFDPDKMSVIKLLIISFVLLVGLNYAFRCGFEMAQLA